MPIIQPDTSEALDLSPIPEGTHKAVIKECPAQLSKEKKTPMIVPKFEITVAGREKPAIRKSFLVTTGEGAGGFDMLLRACHFDELADQYKDPAVNPKPPFDTDQLIGQELDLVIVPDMFQRKDSAGNNLGSPELGDRIKGYQKR
jgi:hypothetical protein